MMHFFFILLSRSFHSMFEQKQSKCKSEVAIQKSKCIFYFHSMLEQMRGFVQRLVDKKPINLNHKEIKKKSN